MLYYSNQPSIRLFNAVTLTNAFSGNRKEFTTEGFSKLTLYTTYAQGGGETSNTLEFQLDASHNGTDWFTLVVDTTTASTSVVTAREWQMSTGSLNVILDIAYPHMRMSLKETGVVTNAGTASVHCTLSGL
jgi:hypothetical protein